MNEILRGVFLAEPKFKKILKEHTPFGIIVLPEYQKKKTIFLASDLAAHITEGQLVISCGEFMDI